MVFADVVLQCLSLTGREVTEVTRIAETFMSCLLVPPQISCNGDFYFVRLNMDNKPGKL